jgi:putative addiction module component (TIGR02574 family)
MTNQTLADLRATALRLSVSERAKLAHDLVASLDGTADPNALDQWDAELLRRLAEVESGNANLLSRQEFRDRIRERLTKP